MSTHVFKVGGPLSVSDATYVERDADRDALMHLQSMQYLLITEPRQQGKTSFLARLCANYDPQSFVMGYVDMSDLSYETEQAWFTDLCNKLSDHLEVVFGKELPAISTSRQEWRGYLRSLASLAHARSLRVVVALDEIGVMAKMSWAEPFFVSLRTFFDERAFVPFYERVTFILAGAFHPPDLIRNETISPFNVAQRLRLRDFTAAQVRELVGKGEWREAQANDLAQRIHYWTNGQPYLVQWLCAHLGQEATPADVNAAVEQLRQEDSNHLSTMIDRLGQDTKLLDYIKRIQNGERIKFYPPHLRWQAQLELLGVLSKDETGSCAIRNRICDVALREAFVSAQLPAQTGLDLRMIVSADHRVISYTLHTPGSGDYNFKPVGEVHLNLEPRDLLQHTLDRLSRLSHLSPESRTPLQTRQAIQEILDVGSLLYDELFPAEFRVEYRKWRDRYTGQSLSITSDEPWIPWEMVRPAEYDEGGDTIYDDPPLCQKFQLSRWLAGRPKTDHLMVTEAALICPLSNLQATQSESAFFSNLAALRAGIHIATPLTTVTDVENCFRAGNVQLIHFACHGNFDLSDPNDSKLKLDDGFLRAGQIVGDKLSGLRRAKPIVFINACHAGERGFGLVRLGGWAERFINAGASVFIGSLWEINDQLASRFAIEFYSRLFGLAGHSPMTLGQAFRQARMVIRDLDPANPTWLAYVLYGDSDACIDTGIEDGGVA